MSIFMIFLIFILFLDSIIFSQTLSTDDTQTLNHTTLNFNNFLIIKSRQKRHIWCGRKLTEKLSEICNGCTKHPDVEKIENKRRRIKRENQEILSPLDCCLKRHCSVAELREYAKKYGHCC
uniref:Insulin-like domain-containing protein n=1 Tax=Panagrolaimus superbus TaxID=310955 RepID=A0A914YQD7_9BILA